MGSKAGPVEYLAVPLNNGGATQGVFVIAHFTQAQRADADAVLRMGAMVSVVMLLLATLMAWFVSGRLLRPLRDLKEAAESISETDLSRRIPVTGSDEVSQLADTFNAMLDRLEAAFVQQRAFVDDASHELRTPIIIIRGHLELMGDDPAERREVMKIVSDELDRMARIVEDLLILAKAELPDFVQHDDVELVDFVTELFAKCKTLGDRRWKLEGRYEGIASLDRQRISQAVLNLARNAVEHTEAGSEIGFGCSHADGQLRLWVRDTGTGVSQEEIKRIFERFSRGKEGRKRSEGAGLGLAIVQSVAEGHGGSVEVASEVGAGATFTLVIPVRDKDSSVSTDQLIVIQPLVDVVPAGEAPTVEQPATSSAKHEAPTVEQPDVGPRLG